MTPAKKMLLVPAVIAGAGLLAAAAFFLAAGRSGPEELWYAMARTPGAPPFGYEHVLLGENANYRGRSAVRNRIVRVLSLESFGSSNDLRTTTDYFLSPDGSLLGFFRKTEYNDITTVAEIWGEGDRLKVEKRMVGEEKVFSRDLPLPRGVMFPTSPAFLYPVVKGSSEPVSFDIFDFDRLGPLRVFSKPLGTSRLELPGVTAEAEGFEIRMVDLSTGVESDKQRLYFDKKGRLLLSEALGPDGKPRNVRFLSSAKVEKELQPRKEIYPPLPYQGLPFRPEEPYLLLISMEGSEVGRASFIFHEQSDTGKYRIEYVTRFVGPTEERSQTANLYLDADLTCVRYFVSGKVYDKDQDKVNVSYSRSMIHSGDEIRWAAWAEGNAKDQGGDKKGIIETENKVYIIDLHLFPGFAVIASQIPLKVGATFTVPVFHSGMDSAGVMQARVLDKRVEKGRSLYAVDMVGFAGRFILLIDEKHLLRRLVKRLDAKGERSIVYDLVAAPKPQ